MEWYKIVAVVWIASAAVRYIKYRPVMQRQRDLICKLFLDMGLTPMQMHEAGFMRGLQIVKWLEPVLSFVHTPTMLVRENIRFFNPIPDHQIFLTSVDLFRKMVYWEGTYVRMLEAYEQRMNEEGERRFGTH